MKRLLADRGGIGDALFTLAVLAWIASLVTVFSIGYLIAPFAAALFAAALAFRFNAQRAIVAALASASAAWMLWAAFG